MADRTSFRDRVSAVLFDDFLVRGEEMNELMFAEIERLRAIERRTRIAAEMVWSEVPDGYQDGYHDAATQILGFDE